MAIRIQDIVIEGSTTWYLPTNISTLSVADESGCSNILCGLLKGNLIEKDQYGSMIKVEDRIYIAPSKAKRFWEYNINTTELVELGLDNSWVNNEKIRDFRKFGEALRVGNEIYFLGVGYPGLVSVNVNDNKMSFWEIDSKIISECEGRYLARNAVVIEHILYVPLWRDNKILKFDTRTKQYDVIRVGKGHYVSVTYDGEKLWLIPDRMEGVTIWNPSSDVIKEVDISCGNLKCKEEFPFYSGIFQNGYVWLLPMQSNYILKVDALAYEVVGFHEISNFTANKLQFINAKIINAKKICGIHDANNCIYVIDSLTGEIEKIILKNSENLYEYLNFDKIVKNSFIIPEDVCGLEYYIQMLCNTT